MTGGADNRNSYRKPVRRDSVARRNPIQPTSKHSQSHKKYGQLLQLQDKKSETRQLANILLQTGLTVQYKTANSSRAKGQESSPPPLCSKYSFADPILFVQNYFRNKKIPALFLRKFLDQFLSHSLIFLRIGMIFY